MKFIVQQVALAINRDREPEAFKLLAALGIDDWVHDTVRAEGTVYGVPAANCADLSFNYTALKSTYELELLRYREGDNWMAREGEPRASHIGTHVTEEELAAWTVVLRDDLRLPIVQEVFTQSHTNEVIAGKRWYHYVIFGARDLIGVDVKFIVRRNSL